MFAAVLITEALAAGGAPAAAGADPQTIMAVVGGLVSGVMLGVSALLYGGGKSVSKPPAAPADAMVFGPGVQLFTQGPVSDLQDKVAALLVAVEKLSAMHYETREQVAQGLHVTRHDLRGELGADRLEASAELGQATALISDIERRISDLHLTLGRLDEYVRAKL